MSAILAREKLRAYKAEHALSLRDLGELLGVSGANVEALLRTRQMPRITLALRIERVCDIPTSDWGVETVGPGVVDDVSTAGR